MQIPSMSRTQTKGLGAGLLLVGLLVVIVFFLFPRVHTIQADPSQSASSNTLRIDVELITVEVIALDKKGKPIQTLKKEDFRLMEDGKQQQIITFDAVNDSGAQPVPTSLADVDEQNRRGKVVLILFDDSTITSSQIKLTRDSAEKYVQQHMRPQDLFGVASYGLSMKIIQNFTHDAGKVVEAIRQPAM